MEVIPGLPEEVGIECLIRVHHNSLESMRGVCRRWRDVISSSDFYTFRRSGGFADKFVCFVQQTHPLAAPVAGWAEKGRPPVYGLTLFDPVANSWQKLPHPNDVCGGLPLFCRCVCAAGGRLVVLGGWDPIVWTATRTVFVYDFKTRKWREGKDMPGSTRSFFGAAALGEKVYVAGGHDDRKMALRSVMVYDVVSDEWEELREEMVEERDECEAVVVDGKLWVVGGYSTERQGRFSGSAEVLDEEGGEKLWRKVEGVWEEGKCARGCVVGISISKDGNKKVAGVVNRGGGGGGGGNDGVRMGRCAVSSGRSGWSVVTESGQDGCPGCYVVKERKDGKEEWIQVERPADFVGFVQSGCYIEV